MGSPAGMGRVGLRGCDRLPGEGECLPGRPDHPGSARRVRQCRGPPTCRHAESVGWVWWVWWVCSNPTRETVISGRERYRHVLTVFVWRLKRTHLTHQTHRSSVEAPPPDACARHHR